MTRATAEERFLEARDFDESNRYVNRHQTSMRKASRECKVNPVAFLRLVSGSCICPGHERYADSGKTDLGALIRTAEPPWGRPGLRAEPEGSTPGTQLRPAPARPQRKSGDHSV